MKKKTEQATAFAIFQGKSPLRKKLREKGAWQ
jgi:hypothetical protein